MSIFKTKYRVSRDRIFSYRWAVQQKVWWWPFWVEHGMGLLHSREEAEELIQLLIDVRSA